MRFINVLFHVDGLFLEFIHFNSLGHNRILMLLHSQIYQKET